jgi:hypothetical protein
MNPICISVPPSSLSGNNSPKLGVTVNTWSPPGAKCALNGNDLLLKKKKIKIRNKVFFFNNYY